MTDQPKAANRDDLTLAEKLRTRRHSSVLDNHAANEIEALNDLLTAVAAEWDCIGHPARHNQAHPAGRLNLLVRPWAPSESGADQ